MDIPGNMEWVADLIPDLSARLEPFVVETDELDAELIEIFAEEIERLANELRDGLAQNNSENMRSAAHSIKGMGGTIGLPEISVLGLEIENMAKEDRLAETRPLVDGLNHWLKTFRWEQKCQPTTRKH